MYYSKIVHKRVQYFVYLISVDFTFDLVMSYNFLRLMTCRPRAFCPITTISVEITKVQACLGLKTFSFTPNFPPLRGLPDRFD